LIRVEHEISQLRTQERQRTTRLRELVELVLDAEEPLVVAEPAAVTAGEASTIALPIENPDDVLAGGLRFVAMTVTKSPNCDTPAGT
jgi:predicted nucleic acid-binding protein